ncbi:MAG: hypothetical protein V8R39_05260 [Clostridia bacterium]|jgi:hypothetical protein
MVNEYSRNYTEVLEILKYIPIDEYNKIPKQKIEFYEKYKDRSYKYEYNFNSISKNTKCILTNLYKDYIANDKEKELINSILNLNWQKKEYEKRKLYNPNSIFS